jgi:hypothetical protein
VRATGGAPARDATAAFVDSLCAVFSTRLRAYMRVGFAGSVLTAADQLAMARISFPKASPNNLTVSTKGIRCRRHLSRYLSRFRNNRSAGSCFRNGRAWIRRVLVIRSGQPKSQLPEMLEEHNVIWRRCRI